MAESPAAASAASHARWVSATGADLLAAEGRSLGWLEAAQRLDELQRLRAEQRQARRAQTAGSA
jgi:hypothetical protein